MTIARSTDRCDPITGQVLSEHDALERLVGLEAALVELDVHIASTKAHLKELQDERTQREAQIRQLIRIPSPSPTPLFDGDPT